MGQFFKFLVSSILQSFFHHAYNLSKLAFCYQSVLQPLPYQSTNERKNYPIGFCERHYQGN